MNELLKLQKKNRLSSNFEENKVKITVMITNSGQKNQNNVSLFSGLQMTDVELDSRVTALEEIGDGLVSGKTSQSYFNIFILAIFKKEVVIR